MKSKTKPKSGRKHRACGLMVLLVMGTLAAVIYLGLEPAHQQNPATWRQFLPGRPHGIIIHHSATPATASGRRVDVEFIDEMHARRGFGRASTKRLYHVGYHYVILRDGSIQRGRPEWMPGAHTKGHNDQLGVCLIGNFSSSANPRGTHGPARPSAAQMIALDHLLKTLITRYGFGPSQVHRHRDYAPTACPGDRLPFDQVRRRAFSL